MVFSYSIQSQLYFAASHNQTANIEAVYSIFTLGAFNSLNLERQFTDCIKISCHINIQHVKPCYSKYIGQCSPKPTVKSQKPGRFLEFYAGNKPLNGNTMKFT